MYFPGFPGGSVIKNQLCNAGNLFDPLSGKIPHALGPLSPCTTTPEPGPQLRQPTTAETPTPRTRAPNQEKPPQGKPAHPNNSSATHCN